LAWCVCTGYMTLQGGALLRCGRGVAQEEVLLFEHAALARACTACSELVQRARTARLVVTATALAVWLAGGACRPQLPGQEERLLAALHARLVSGGVIELDAASGTSRVWSDIQSVFRACLYSDAVAAALLRGPLWPAGKSRAAAVDAARTLLKDRDEPLLALRQLVARWGSDHACGNLHALRCAVADLQADLVARGGQLPFGFHKKGRHALAAAAAHKCGGCCSAFGYLAGLGPQVRPSATARGEGSGGLPPAGGIRRGVADATRGDSSGSGTESAAGTGSLEAAGVREGSDADDEDFGAGGVHARGAAAGDGGRRSPRGGSEGRRGGAVRPGARSAGTVRKASHQLCG